ncbi:MAG: hypothetical protein NVSMB3_10450 [Acidobacteriaceae bacterium]
MRANISAGVIFVVGALLLLGSIATQSGRLTDFTSYYVAGATILHQPHALYSLSLQMGEQARVVGSPGFLPWVHLPIEAVLVAPLSLLPYRWAFTVWAALNLCALGLIGYLLRGTVRGYSVLCFAALPILAGLVIGQDHVLIALLFVLAYRSFKRQEEFAAGGLLGLCLLRYQFALPMLFFFLVARRWRVLGGAAIVGLALAASSFALAGKAFAVQYLRLVGFLARVYDPQTDPDMPNLHWLVIHWRLPHPMGVTALLSLFALGAGAAVWARREYEPTSSTFDLMFALAAILALLCSYHTLTYDLTLLTLPMLLLARDEPRSTAVIWMASACLCVAFVLRSHQSYIALPLIVLAALAASGLERSLPARAVLRGHAARGR